MFNNKRIEALEKRQADDVVRIHKDIAELFNAKASKFSVEGDKELREIQNIQRNQRITKIEETLSLLLSHLNLEKVTTPEKTELKTKLTYWTEAKDLNKWMDDNFIPTPKKSQPKKK